jgi:hypothetical protein
MRYSSGTKCTEHIGKQHIVLINKNETYFEASSVCVCVKEDFDHMGTAVSMLSEFHSSIPASCCCCWWSCRNGTAAASGTTTYGGGGWWWKNPSPMTASYVVVVVAGGSWLLGKLTLALAPRMRRWRRCRARRARPWPGRGSPPPTCPTAAAGCRGTSSCAHASSPALQRAVDQLIPCSRSLAFACRRIRKHTLELEVGFWMERGEENVTVPAWWSATGHDDARRAPPPARSPPRRGPACCHRPGAAGCTRR